MATSEDQVWNAIFTVLKNNAVLIALIPWSDGKAAVFDNNNVPVGLSPPYVVLGEATSVPEDTFKKRGFNATAMIHSWSEFAGKEEILAIRNAIHTALNETVLTLSTYKCIICLYDSGNVMVDDTTSINKWHGADRYRIQTQEV